MYDRIVTNVFVHITSDKDKMTEGKPDKVIAPKHLLIILWLIPVNILRLTFRLIGLSERFRWRNVVGNNVNHRRKRPVCIIPAGIF